jgi:hypothetical protein
LTPWFFIYSLRSGELSAMVRRAFPATSNISYEFRFHSKIHLDLLYVVMYSFLRIHHGLIVPFSFSSPARNDHGRPMSVVALLSVC